MTNDEIGTLIMDMRSRDDKRDHLLMEIHADIRENRTFIRDHHKALFGNGQPGIMTRLTTMESKCRAGTCDQGGSSTTKQLVYGGGAAGAIVAVVEGLKMLLGWNAGR